MITAVITGSLSAISSSLIIYLILRSEAKLSTIYHRIMFAMSCADILLSIALLLTTLPMPQDFPCTGTEETMRAPWMDGVGTIETCVAQGFIIDFGHQTMYSYNAMLCLYYTCAIVFKMKEEDIHKRVEPFLLSIPPMIGLGLSIPPLFLGMYNPGNQWCSINYIECSTVNDDITGDHYQYTRGSKRLMFTYVRVSLFLILTILIITFVSFALMIRRARVIDIELFENLRTSTSGMLQSQFRNTAHQNTNTNTANANTNANANANTNTNTNTIREESSASDFDLTQVALRHQTTKIILKQAVAYSVALFLTLLFPLIFFISLSFNQLEARFEMQSNSTLMMLVGVFVPIQGFFNFIIFLSHKVYNYRRSNENKDVALCTILYHFFCDGQVQEPILFSRISLVRLDQQDSLSNYNLTLEVENEYGHENVVLNISVVDETIITDEQQSMSNESSSVARQSDDRHGEIILEQDAVYSHHESMDHESLNDTSGVADPWTDAFITDDMTSSSYYSNSNDDTDVSYHPSVSNMNMASSIPRGHDS